MGNTSSNSKTKNNNSKIEPKDNKKVSEKDKEEVKGSEISQQSKQIQKNNNKNNNYNYEWEKDGSVKVRLSFDDWYSIVKLYTMRSQLIPIDIHEIRAIMNAHESKRPQNKGMTISNKDLEYLEIFKQRIQLFIDQQQQQQGQGQEQEQEQEQEQKPGQEQGQGQEQEQQQEEQKEEKKDITTTTTTTKKTTGIFLRFSNRSPKDSILRMHQDTFQANVQKLAIEIYHSQMKDLAQFSKEAQVVNAILRALTILSSSQLCIQDAQMAMDLVLYSERIFTDFKLGELMKGDDYKTQLILRDFNHDIDFECEFRCFVYKNSMTCISQYNSLVYIPRIVKNKSQILQAITKYWKSNIQSLMEQAQITSYVLDVGLLKEKEKEKDDNIELVLIEMNPFSTKAGPLLFDWKEDIELLLNSNPITFRINEAPHEQKPDKLTSEVDQVFKMVYDILIQT